LDIGETDDFTAWGRIWVLTDGRVAVKMRYYLPRIALQRYQTRPYAQWERAGLLIVTDGDVTDYGILRRDIEQDHQDLGIQSVFYDPKTARETAQILMGAGLDMVPMPQGFALNEAITKLLELVTAGQVCHGDDPILAWMADNTVLVFGTKGEKRLAKERAPEKIDGIAALVMGLEGAVVRREREQEITESSVFIFSGGRR
jgi:phage terminase large subunit-like protein